MDEAEADDAVRALVVTASGDRMFSPGVDLPTVFGYDEGGVRRFFDEMTRLVRRKFAFPKAEVYALNGHAIAGGSIMALAGEARVMARGPYRIGLMEIDLGLAAPISVALMVRSLFGGRLAGEMLLGGATWEPDEAHALGIVDEVAEPPQLLERAMARAQVFADKPPAGYRRLKHYLRGEVAERMERLDEAHNEELVRQWFDPEVQAALRAAVESMTRPKGAGSPA